MQFNEPFNVIYVDVGKEPAEKIGLNHCNVLNKMLHNIFMTSFHI